jgi:hypothetical protein
VQVPHATLVQVPHATLVRRLKPHTACIARDKKSSASTVVSSHNSNISKRSAMLDNLNPVFPAMQNQEARLEQDMAREQTAKPHPADEISLLMGYWQKDLAQYFLVQFGTF